MKIDANSIKQIFESTPKYNPQEFLYQTGAILLDEFSDIKLIGQIERPEGEETYRVFQKYLSKILKFYFNDKFNPHFFEFKEARAVIALYFVWTGIFDYGEDRGKELWPHIFEGLGCCHNTNLSSPSGQLFLKCLEENQLEQFSDIPTNFKYVTPILLHGLIPDIHMNKFIEEYILTEFENIKARYETGESVIRRWKNEPKLSTQPKPIEYFIKYGQPINAELIERFWHMLLNWKDAKHGEWWHWSIPKYMFDAFEKHSDKKFNINRDILKKKEHTGRPVILFDFERSDIPFIQIPSQKIKERNSTIIINYRSCIRNSTPSTSKHEIGVPIIIAGQSYSNSEELPVFPSRIWEIGIQDSSGFNKIISIENSFKFPNANNNIPVFLFNSNSNKLVKYNENTTIPNNLLIVFPQNASVKLKNGEQFTEEIQLSGEWREWKYFNCSVNKSTTVQYSGPDIFFNTNIEENFKFNTLDSVNVKPEIKCKNEVPGWMRCREDDLPIVLNLELMYIYFPGDSYKLWRRNSVVKLILPGEKVSQDQIVFRPDFIEADNGKLVFIPMSQSLQPGVYEIHVIGALGVENIILPFVFFPVNSFKTEFSNDNTQIIKNFFFKLHYDIPLEPLGNTNFILSDNVATISVIDDSGDAFCALKLFPKSHASVILLFARNQIRWVRRSESGLFSWVDWKVWPEEISVQRLNELSDSKVHIEIDREYGDSIRVDKKNKLRLLLKNNSGNNNDSTSLMSYNAPNHKRKTKNLWDINLKQFSDQLKYIENVQAADIVIDKYGRQEKTIFSLLRFPEYKEFSVKTIKHEKNKEHIEVYWVVHPNDPLKKRVLTFQQKNNPKQKFTKSLPDNMHPPFIVEIDATNEAEEWIVQIDIKRSRFGGSFSKIKENKTSITWLRIPPDWKDWISLAHIRPDSIHEKYSGFQNDNNKVKENIVLPWISFLQAFHNKNNNLNESFVKYVGVENLLKIFPISKRNHWQVRKGIKKIFEIEIVDSTLNTGTIQSDYVNCNATAWYKIIPDDTLITFKMRDNHKYLGNAGTFWYCYKSVGNTEPVMSSSENGELELSTWLADAVDSEEHGFLSAGFPLKNVWMNSCWLPISDPFNANDSVFISASSDSDSPFSVLKKLGDTENNKVCINFVAAWKDMFPKLNANGLLKKIIFSRVDSVPFLTGLLSFVLRLKANGYDNLLDIDSDSNLAQQANGLFKETFKFVSKNLAGTFLNDLILCEILINWYWRKKIISLDD